MKQQEKYSTLPDTNTVEKLVRRSATLISVAPSSQQVNTPKTSKKQEEDEHYNIQYISLLHEKWLQPTLSREGRTCIIWESLHSMPYL
ncbi:Metal transporter cnnm-1 [Dirofilaria immitis]